jgi:hypothetical protein
MARYRIVRRPSRMRPGGACYDVERFSWSFSWEFIDVYLTIEGAQAFIDECKKLEAGPPIKREVVWESEP